MKIFKYCLLYTMYIVVCSCSSNDDEATNNNVDPFKSQFELFINGELVSSEIGNSVFKTEETISFGGYPDSLLSFNTSGQFGSFYVYYAVEFPTQTSLFYSFRGFSSTYFDFYLEELNEVEKTVKGGFSGYIYANPLDLNSEKKYVSGSFYTKYKDVIPAITNIGNKVKINGNQWTSSNRYITRESNNYFQVTQHDLSDDPYKIMIKYDYIDINVGTYHFTNSDITNKVQLAKFDITTASFVNYNCEGTLNITRRDGSFTGNYNFIATHPITGEVLTLTDGAFKLIYRAS